MAINPTSYPPPPLFSRERPPLRELETAPLSGSSALSHADEQGEQAAQLRRLLDLARHAGADRGLARALPFLIAPLLAACGGGGSDSPTTDIRTVRLTAENPNFREPDAAAPVRVTGHDGRNWIETGRGDDEVNAGGGNDNVDGGAGADTLDGGGGSDSLSYWNSNAGVTVNLKTGQASGGHAQGDSFSNFESLAGSRHADTLTGDDGDNRIAGQGGADTLDGGYDGAFGDWLSYADSNAGVTVNLKTGQASGGHAEGDSFSNFENLFGSQHADTLTGDDGDNWIAGQGGADSLEGGGGADIFSFSHIERGDRILDFTAEDKIDLSWVDLDEVNIHAFVFVGTAAFTNSAGELRYQDDGNGNLLLQGDVDGDGDAEFEVALEGVSSITADDLILA